MGWTDFLPPQLQVVLNNTQPGESKNWFPAYESRFWTELKPALEKGAIKMSAANEAWRNFNSAVQQSGNWEGAWKSYVQPLVNEGLKQIDIQNETPPPPTETPIPEPYKFEKTDEMKQIEDLINSRTLNTPTFNPENVTKWVSTLDTAYKPYEQKALDQAQGEYRRLFGGLSGGGSASFNRVIQQPLAEQQALKQQTALGLAQSEYDKQYQDYINARGQALDLQKFYADQSKYTNAQEMQNAWNRIQRQWELTDAATQRGNEEQDWQKQADLARQLAEMTKPQETNWYDYILPAIGTGLGYGLGGGITGATTNLFSKLFKSAPKNYAATPVTAGTPDYLKLYGLK